MAEVDTSKLDLLLASIPRRDFVRGSGTMLALNDALAVGQMRDVAFGPMRDGADFMRIDILRRADEVVKERLEEHGERPNYKRVLLETLGWLGETGRVDVFGVEGRKVDVGISPAGIIRNLIRRKDGKTV